ncbi:hypothetical protein [Sphaerisporangium sp. TRM90804]|uniref:hypothetical protein n=1 Tax=Sphaerisporangium sp. TRM90804 TaxID=3031113 RepID=UPI00244A681B|nr:hypothetical protein [Sphaerisporangium sp. TRM90804]MDH2429012.1 hypothetical protein [Sphaerisporangium sp. TRM90804]
MVLQQPDLDRPARMIVGLDAGSRTVAEAEHLITDTVKALGLPAGTVACTHFVRSGTGAPHVACSLAVADRPVGALSVPDGVGLAYGETRTGPAELAEGAALAAAEHAAGSAGRLVLFPGRDELVGTLSVAEVLARSAVERVVVLAHADEPRPGTPLATGDHVRPQWREGRIVLLTMPAAGGRLMPAEVPNPTPCCVDHD